MSSHHSHKPNIIFFFTDDQRFDTIQALGNPDIHTPNLDRLVRRGTSFVQAHIPSGTSPAVCMPSRAMLHTGRTLFHLEGEGQQIPRDHATLGEALQRAGYRTYGSGKWHNGTSAFARSFTDGDAIFFGGMWDHWNVPLNRFDPTGKYDNKIPFTMNFMNDNRVTQVHGDEFSMGKHSTDVISEAAIRFIGEYQEEQPYFMYLSFLAPHDPRSMPKRFMDLYDPEQTRIPANFREEHAFHYGVREIRDERLAPYPRTVKEIQRHVAEYYAMISHLDHEIGRVMEAVRQAGREEDTIFILAGDNGLAIGQHGLMGKQSHYEHSVRVPLIFAGPGIPAGETRNQYVYLLDIFPTLCEWIGADIPDSVEGISLAAAVRDANATVRDQLYFAYTDLIRSVKNDRYKLIEYTGDTRRTQLFDLQEDPWEVRDLYGKPEAEPIVADLRVRLKQCRDEWDEVRHPLGERFWSRYGEE